MYVVYKQQPHQQSFRNAKKQKNTKKAFTLSVVLLFVMTNGMSCQKGVKSILNHFSNYFFLEKDFFVMLFFLANYLLNDLTLRV